MRIREEGVYYFTGRPGLGVELDRIFDIIYLCFHFSMSVVFDILSLNTAGIGDSIKRCKLFNYAKKHTSSARIFFLQETHSSEKNERLWVNQWGCGIEAVIFSHCSSNARGVLIMPSGNHLIAKFCQSHSIAMGSLS